MAAFYSRIGRALLPARASTQAASVPVGFPASASTPTMRRDLFADAQAFGVNEIVHACVRLRSEVLAEARIEVVNARDEVVNDGVLARLLREPSPGMSLRDWLSCISLYYDVAGNVYFHRLRNARGALIGYELLRPDRVFIRPGERREPYYDYRANGVTRIPWEEVAHYKAPNPTNDWYGLGPVAVCANMLNIDKSATNLTRTWLDNYGIAAGFVITEQEPKGAEEVAKIRDSFARIFSGRNIGKIGVLWGKMRYETARTVEAPESEGVRDLTESRIPLIFGVSPHLINARIGLKETSGTSDFAQERRSFYNETMRPLWLDLESFLNVLIVDDFPGLRVRLDLDSIPALQPELKQRAEVAKLNVEAGMMTPNEGREYQGFAAYDGEGDERYVRTNLARVNGEGAGAEGAGEGVE